MEDISTFHFIRQVRDFLHGIGLALLAIVRLAQLQGLKPSCTHMGGVIPNPRAEIACATGSIKPSLRVGTMLKLIAISEGSHVLFLIVFFFAGLCHMHLNLTAKR